MCQENVQKPQNPQKPNRIPIGEFAVIYLRGKKKIWNLDYSFVGDDGRRRHGRRSLRTRNQRVAEGRGLELVSKLREGLSPSEAKPVLTRVSDAVTRYMEFLDTDSRARKTTVKYRQVLNAFAAFVEDKGAAHLSKITPSMIDSFRAHKKDDGLQPYTLYTYMMIVKGWLKWCKKRKLVAESAMNDFQLRKPRRRKHAAMSFKELTDLLNRATGTAFAVYMTLAFTGLRIGELITLRPVDVDLENGSIRVRSHGDFKTKTQDSERQIPIHPRLLAVLKAMRRQAGLPVFTATASGKFPKGDHRINPRTANAVFQKLASADGSAVGRETEDGLTLHSLRRFFRTFCLNNGVPAAMVSIWMGHANPDSMDNYYYDTGLNESKKMMDKLPFGEPNARDSSQLKAAQLKGLGL